MRLGRGTVGRGRRPERGLVGFDSVGTCLLRPGGSGRLRCRWNVGGRTAQEAQREHSRLRCFLQSPDEVDKTRQILIKVWGNKVVGVLSVSSGATRHTSEDCAGPVGRHRRPHGAAQESAIGRWYLPTTRSRFIAGGRSLSYPTSRGFVRRSRRLIGSTIALP